MFKKSEKNDTANFYVGGRGTSTKLTHIVWVTQKSTHPVQVRYSRIKSIRSVAQTTPPWTFDVQDVLVTVLQHDVANLTDEGPFTELFEHAFTLLAAKFAGLETEIESGDSYGWRNSG
ncbi:hypothetical protein [Gracilibacillus alcaliphilus]